MIRFNVSGFVMVSICAVVWWMLPSLGVSATLADHVMIGLMFLLDVVYRLRNGETGLRQKWFAGRTGGFFGFTPVWLTAVLFLGVVQFGSLSQ